MSKSADGAEDSLHEDMLRQYERALISVARRMTDTGGSDLGVRVGKMNFAITLDLPFGEIESNFSFVSRRYGKLLTELDSAAIEALRVNRPTYAQLSGNYSCDTHSCSMTVEDTCALRVSEALIKTNSAWVDVFRNSGKNLCDSKFVRGAQDLAAILESSSGFGVYDFGIDEPKGKVPSAVKNKQGIIVYMDIPTFPQGQGHIALWNKTDGHCSGGGPDAYWDAKRVWFWKLP